MAQGEIMEPRIQYAKTSDGVNIAFWELGEGPTLVYLPGAYGLDCISISWVVLPAAESTS